VTMAYYATLARRKH